MTFFLGCVTVLAGLDRSPKQHRVSVGATLGSPALVSCNIVVFGFMVTGSWLRISGYGWVIFSGANGEFL